MPFTGELRAAGLAKETAVGTLKTPPDAYIPYIPPAGFELAIDLLESQGIRAIPDVVYKVSQGAAHLTGLKLKLEAEPENIGQMLMATFGGTDTPVLSAATVYTHTFMRAAVSQLPTYTWWLDKGVLYPQFVGCMMNKLDIGIKAKDFVTLDTDWTGLSYDSTGISRTPAYSARKPFVFNQAVVKVDTVVVNNYDNIKISIDNMVKADPALNGSIYPAKIYSEGMKVTVSMDLLLEDATQWNKFLAGTSASLNIAITSSEIIAGSTGSIPYSLTLDIPTINYKAAPIPSAKGLFKINFTGIAIYTVGSTKTLSAALANSVSTGY